MKDLLYEVIYLVCRSQDAQGSRDSTEIKFDPNGIIHSMQKMFGK